MTEPTIRPLTPTDVEAVRQLVVETLGVDRPAAVFLADLKWARYEGWVLEIEGAVCGWLSCAWVLDEMEHHLDGGKRHVYIDAKIQYFEAGDLPVDSQHWHVDGSIVARECKSASPFLACVRSLLSPDSSGCRRRNPGGAGGRQWDSAHQVGRLACSRRRRRDRDDHRIEMKQQVESIQASSTLVHPRRPPVFASGTRAVHWES